MILFLCRTGKMQYESLIKMDMHELKVYYNMLVKEIKEEDENAKKNQEGGGQMNMPTMPQMPSMPQMPALPNISFPH